MISSLIDKASSLIGGSFFQAYWFPTFFASCLVVLIRVLGIGPGLVWEWWQSMGGKQTAAQSAQATSDFAQVWILAAFLLAVTIFAYLLQVFSFPIIQLYEGYWPLRIRKYWASKAVTRWKAIKKERQDAVSRDDFEVYRYLQDIFYHQFPPEESLILPTQLGNVLQSAEAYSTTSYGMDSVFWWPRVVYVIEKETLEAIDEAITPMIMMINMSGLFIAVTAYGIFFLAGMGISIFWMAGLAVGGLVLSYIAYKGAVSQAMSYGLMIRSAIDTHRFKLLQELHIPLPPTPDKEKKLWRDLEAWLYNRDPGALSEIKYQHNAEAKPGNLLSRMMAKLLGKK